jgi:hypothetical protein
MAAGKRLWGNRKERKAWARRLQSEDPGLEIVHPNAAGIDVGNSAHYAAVRPDRDVEPVRRFECFTDDQDSYKRSNISSCSHRPFLQPESHMSARSGLLQSL